MYSALDLKSGFENVVLDPVMARFCGIVMQDGLYVLERMTFGFNIAPAHFQAIMMTVMDAEPNRPTNATYIDDIMVAANQAQECWRDTLETIQCMLRTGFPINAWKLQLLQRHINILGVLMCNSRFQLGNKALGKLFGSALPRSCKELMALLGHLNFAA